MGITNSKEIKSPQNSNQPITSLKGVGAAITLKLNSLGIFRIQDLLFHLPIRYEDRTRITPIRSVGIGERAVIEGKIELSEINFAGRRRTLKCVISDGHALLECRFFHFSASQKNSMINGKKMRCYGEVRRGGKYFQMVHPEYRIFEEGNAPPLEDKLTPIYPTTEGINQKRWQNLITQSLSLIKQLPPKEWLPAKLLEQYNFPDLMSSLLTLHSPGVEVSLSKFEQGATAPQRRLAFEELLAHQLSMKKIRQQIRSVKAPACKTVDEIGRALIKQLPFQLTAAQQRVGEEIKFDIAQNKPMLRLVQGDVGCGKTLVAALAATQVISAGYQVAMMAPTEILAEQHATSFSQWLIPLGIEVAWLSGKFKGKARKQTESAITSGKARMIVGTHALFQKTVEFEKLGLVIIDEQHRFGVHQRMALREKGVDGNSVPHQLIMTATPIPRTLAMTAYADLDTSIIDELPPGRTPVTTAVVTDSRREEVIQRVQKACLQGRQAYWVCTLIEESEALQCQAAEVTAEKLTEQLSGIKVGLIHGRLKAAEKESIMQQFKNQQIDLLVATTVIEVGVDVPNASLMIIENPERLGLSQLHQLRGRVGRGSDASHCVLLYHSPLSRNGKQRLAVMRETNDGFKIAEKDLELRGPGEVLGTKQTGIAEFKIADLVRDQDLIPAVNEWAKKLIVEDVNASEGIIKRWIANSGRYADV
jgi:ATP-dependent DNA helicase RecG